LITAFNIRVYGIFVNEKKQILLSDEKIRNNNLAVTKFPGGGLEFGEGTIDCIKRECIEELGIGVEVTNHLYTTDFFQPSAFNDADQIISIYYMIKPLVPPDFPVNNGLAVFPEKISEKFRFMDWEYFNENVMTLPIDKVVAKMLKTLSSI
jgi:8-oxo-dGTP pyrophosphatase MutT (NUDIX family)